VLVGGTHGDQWEQQEMDDIVTVDVSVPQHEPLFGAALKCFLESAEATRLHEQAKEEKSAMLREVELAKGQLRLKMIMGLLCNQNVSLILSVVLIHQNLLVVPVASVMWYYDGINSKRGGGGGGMDNKSLSAMAGGVGGGGVGGAANKVSEEEDNVVENDMN